MGENPVRGSLVRFKWRGTGNGFVSRTILLRVVSNKGGRVRELEEEVVRIGGYERRVKEVERVTEMEMSEGRI